MGTVLLISDLATKAQIVMRKKESRPLSRVLSWTVIPLGTVSPQSSSSLPGSARRSGAAVPPPLLPYLALLQVGFAVPSLLPATRCALTAPFHPCQHRFRHFGGLLSVALSVGSRPPGVTWHLRPAEPGLSSPQVPCGARAATVWPALQRTPYGLHRGNSIRVRVRRPAASPARMRCGAAHRKSVRQSPPRAPAADPSTAAAATAPAASHHPRPPRGCRRSPA